MWPVSEEFLAAVRGSHRVVTRVEAYFDGEWVADLTPLDGSVSIDSRRAVRRTVSLSFVDDGTLVPAPGGTSGILTPYGAEVRVYRGVALEDGTEELAPLGVFVVTEVEVRDGRAGREITVQGSDRSIRISRNRFTDSYAIAAGTAVETAIGDLLRDRWADVEVSLPAMGATTPATVLRVGSESDPWRDAVDLATNSGWDLAFDADGVVRARLIPDPLEDDPVAIYEDGAEAVVLEVSRGWSTEATYNGVIASSEGSDVDSPLRAEAWDEDANSPTYRYGPFGQVPMFYSSSLIRTSDQAATVAASQLRQQLGRAETISWGQVVNPAHDVLDVVRLLRPSQDLDAVLLIDRLEVPLDPAASMSAAARVREV